MANQTGRPIAPARKLVAAVSGTIAVFVVALGFGMSSLGVVIFGVVLLALSVALGSVNVVRRGARAWVSGTAEVRSISPPPTSAAVYGRARILAVVVAPGLPTSEVEINESKVPVVKWPAPGDTLPITVDVDDMRRVRINWDEAIPREHGEDPPPPPPEYDEFDNESDLDSDLLDDVEPPPWVTRDRQWGRGPEEPPPPPPPSASPPQPGLDDGTVVVRDTPAGPVVEGEFVDHDDTPQTLPRRAPKAATGAESPTVAATAGAAAAGMGTAASTPGTRRPSPHPRGAGSATATAEPTTVTAPPPQREPHPDDLLATDIPLDEPADQPQQPRRPEPVPTSTAPHPSPVGSFPTAPPPSTPPPTAPAPSTPPPAPADDEIDLPLDADPDPAPETTPHAAAAVEDDLIAPPPPSSTRFVSNAAHDATTAASATTSATSAAADGDSAAANLGSADEAARDAAAAPRTAGDDLPPEQRVAAVPWEPEPSSSGRDEAPLADQAGAAPADESRETASGTGSPPRPQEAQPVSTADSETASPPRPQDAEAAQPVSEAQPASATQPASDAQPASAAQPVSAAHSGGQEHSQAKHGLIATAVGAVAAAAVAAVKKAGKQDRDEPPTDDIPAGSAAIPDQPAARPPAPAAAAATAVPAADEPPAGNGPAIAEADADNAARPPAPAAAAAFSVTERASAPQPSAADTGHPTAKPADDTQAQHPTAAPADDTPASHPTATPADDTPAFAHIPAEDADAPIKDADATAEDADATAGAAPPSAHAAASAGESPAAGGAAAWPVREASAAAEEEIAAPRPSAPTPAAAALAAAAAAAAAAGPASGGDKNPWADFAGSREPDESTAEVITAYPSARPGPAGAIHGVGITVLVTDLARSIAFYRDTLGFYEIDSGEGSAVLASGDTRLVLRTVHGLSAEAGRLIYLNLEVGDVEAVYEELRAKGVEFVHAPRPVNRGDRLELWSASFRDPDDHNIAITQWRAIH